MHGDLSRGHGVDKLTVPGSRGGGDEQRSDQVAVAVRLPDRLRSLGKEQLSPLPLRPLGKLSRGTY